MSDRRWDLYSPAPYRSAPEPGVIVKAAIGGAACGLALFAATLSVAGFAKDRLSRFLSP